MVCLGDGHEATAQRWDDDGTAPRLLQLHSTGHRAFLKYLRFRGFRARLTVSNQESGITSGVNIRFNKVLRVPATEDPEDVQKACPNIVFNVGRAVTVAWVKWAIAEGAQKTFN